MLEEFIATCTEEGFVPPHPADVARLERCGVVIKKTPVSVATAEKAAEAIAEKAREQPEAVLEKPEEETPSQKRRKRKHHHSHETREE